MSHMELVFNGQRSVQDQLVYYKNSVYEKLTGLKLK